MISSVEELIQHYIESWNKKTPEEFRTAFLQCWSEIGTYTDPNFALEKGVEAIANLAVGSLKKSPGRKFEVLTQPEYHHNTGRYTWKVIFSDGTSSKGFDFFEFDDEYKITRIVSFF
ncbi:MAG TPA: hypothetical protein VGB84_01190 [Arachidicoccus sp.]